MLSPAIVSSTSPLSSAHRFGCPGITSVVFSWDQRMHLRRAYFNHVKSSLDQGGYRVIDEHVRDEYRSFQLAIEYPTIIVRSADEVLRPHIQIEMSFHPPVLPAVEQTIFSFTGQGHRVATDEGHSSKYSVTLTK